MRSAIINSVVAVGCMVGAAVADDVSAAWTDSNTGIEFQQFTDADTGFSAGIALPESPKSDFIGNIVLPLNNSEGWGGLSLTAEMVGSLLITAWPNGDSVMGSIRETSSYATPAVYSGDATLEPITNGTFINSTHMSYTFLCSGCIVDDLTFTASDTGAVMGWAMADTSPTTPSSASTAFTYHSKGYGDFEMYLSKAYSASYSTWASYASTSTSSGNATSTGNSTASTSSSTAAPYSNTTSTSTTSNITYDYIIAGAGAAGIIVAERLAETNKSVLLLERGGVSTKSSGNNDTLSWNDTITAYDVPALASTLSEIVDTYCTDTADMAGCLLGGGTEVNALMFVKPQEKDFDDKWPTGWKWSDVEEYASKLYERNPGTILPSADGKYYDQPVYNVLSSFFSGLGWSSVNAIEEPNKKEKVYSHPPWSIQDSERAGPVRTYLPLAQGLDNFTLKLNTKVLRVVRDGSAITGIEIENSDGSTEIININTGGKVILAAGTMSTPRILFNSGIGPKAQIQTVQSGSTGITLPDEADWIELPVGKNLKDHPIFTVEFNTNNNFSVFNFDTVETGPSLTNEDLYAQGSGPIAQGGQRLNFWTTVNSTDGITRYIQGTTSAASAGVIKMKIYLTHGLTSSGVLGITSDGYTTFTTDPWMTTAADQTAINNFMQYMIDATSSSNSTLSIVGKTSNMTGSDLATDYVTGDHFVGTAIMGTSNNSAVVDTNTKVFGTDNLFVVDGSIHPDLPTGNTQAIIMVVAEAAAAKIAALDTSSSTSTSSVAASSASVGSHAVTSVAASSVAASVVTTIEGSTTTIVSYVTATAESSDSGSASSGQSSSGQSSGSSSSGQSSSGSSNSGTSSSDSSDSGSSSSSSSSSANDSNSSGSGSSSSSSTSESGSSSSTSSSSGSSSSDADAEVVAAMEEIIQKIMEELKEVIAEDSTNSTLKARGYDHTHAHAKRALLSHFDSLRSSKH
ncbi:MAG: hypothetical protein M1834_006629 [Cirrosporium novae-zelandiae]|nr:MAG: hypothetical protein M1834_006629 [Cirrosporium novae-zelandiae]